MRTITNPIEFRANVRTRVLSQYISDNKVCNNLEKGVYNYAIQEAVARKVVKKWENPYFVQLYEDRLKSIWSNLRKNPRLCARIMSGDIKPGDTAHMTHQEMDPDRWADMVAENTRRIQSKFDYKIEASTDTFTCGKCKSKRCTYYAMQTRSADEPMTLFVTCLDCDHHFKR
jgi:transcription elongation factor S-II